jgi:hypothetical protein
LEFRKIKMKNKLNKTYKNIKLKIKIKRVESYQKTSQTKFLNLNSK